MEEQRPDFLSTPERDAKPGPYAGWVPIALVLTLCFGLGATWLYLTRLKGENRELAATNQSMTTAMTQMQAQLQSLTGQIRDLETSQAAAAPAAAARPRARARNIGESKAAAQRAPSDLRLKEIQDRLAAHQTKLSDQQKQIDNTREDLGKTRDDLQGALTASHDELSGSIAKSHDDIVALQKRGERNYYEFALDKRKQFQRVGPVSLSLRKANAKHKSYDLTMLVDDNQLEKKSVNLYEPVWINLADNPEPLELIVNQVAKDHIEGYLSEPKYKKSELDTSAAVTSGRR